MEEHSHLRRRKASSCGFHGLDRLSPLVLFLHLLREEPVQGTQAWCSSCPVA